jgi:DNA uptake protein ComE-like DNA-binding protein
MPRCLNPVSLAIAVALVALYVTMEYGLQGNRHVCGTAGTVPANGSCAADLLFFRKMDINRVSLEELALLPGIGPATAGDIVVFRQSAGFLLSIDELDPINSGLTTSRFMIVKKYLTT